MHVLRAESYRRMPWKNGGGVTTEIAVSPEGAGLEDFEWRVSMARVESSGPFSAFAGIDRTLAILEGEGLLLDIAGRKPVELTAASAPFSFPADAPTSASLLAGPITDLNVMTRRGRLAHKVTREDVAEPIEIILDTARILLLCHDGGIRLTFGGQQVSLRQFDTAIFESDPSTVRVETNDRAALFRIDIDRIS